MSSAQLCTERLKSRPLSVYQIAYSKQLFQNAGQGLKTYPSMIKAMVGEGLTFEVAKALMSHLNGSPNPSFKILLSVLEFAPLAMSLRRPMLPVVWWPTLQTPCRAGMRCFQH
jgi:hypothetical protein